MSPSECFDSEWTASGQADPWLLQAWAQMGWPEPAVPTERPGAAGLAFDSEDAEPKRFRLCADEKSFAAAARWGGRDSFFDLSGPKGMFDEDAVEFGRSALTEFDAMVEEEKALLAEQEGQEPVYGPPFEGWGWDD